MYFVCIGDIKHRLKRISNPDCNKPMNENNQDEISQYICNELKVIQSIGKKI